MFLFFLFFPILFRFFFVTRRLVLCPLLYFFVFVSPIRFYVLGPGTSRTGGKRTTRPSTRRRVRAFSRLVFLTYVSRLFSLGVFGRRCTDRCASTTPMSKLFRRERGTGGAWPTRGARSVSHALVLPLAHLVQRFNCCRRYLNLRPEKSQVICPRPVLPFSLVLTL